MPRHKSIPDEAVFAALHAAIGEHGPQNLTLERISDIVGLAPATLLQRFGSKHQLLVSASRFAAAAWKGMAESMCKDSTDPVDTILRLLKKPAKQIGSAAELANHLSYLCMDITNEDLGAVGRLHHKQQLSVLRSLVRKAVTAGILREDTPATLPEHLQAVCSGAMINWVFSRRSSLAADVGRSLKLALAPYFTAD